MAGIRLGLGVQVRGLTLGIGMQGRVEDQRVMLMIWGFGIFKHGWPLRTETRQTQNPKPEAEHSASITPRSAANSPINGTFLGQTEV